MKRRANLKTSLVTAFTSAYLLGATIQSVRQGDAEFFLYAFVVLLLGLMTLSLHQHFRFPTALLWCLSIWGLMHLLGGLLHIPETWPRQGVNSVLYNAWIIPGFIRYDNIVHAYGFSLLTWGAWRCLLPRLQRWFPTSGVLILCFLASMGIGALNEMLEFIAVQSGLNTNVGGYADTGWDFIANTVGGVGAGLWIWIAYHEPHIVKQRTKRGRMPEQQAGKRRLS